MDDTGLKLIKQLQVSADLSLAELSRRVGISKTACWNRMQKMEEEGIVLGKQVLFDIDVKGGLTIKKKYPKQTLSIFVQPPSIEELENRLRHRATDSEEKINERIGKAKGELTFSERFDYCLINDDLETAKKEKPKRVSGLVVKHLILLISKSPSILKLISQPNDLPIQFFCITLTLFGHSSKF